MWLAKEAMQADCPSSSDSDSEEGTGPPALGSRAPSKYLRSRQRAQAGYPKRQTDRRLAVSHE